MSPRSPLTNPAIPGGPAHRLADNYYYTRDVRGAVAPPVVASSSFKQLTSKDTITRSNSDTGSSKLAGFI